MFLEFFIQSSILVKGVMILLMFLSVYTMYLSIVYYRILIQKEREKNIFSERFSSSNLNLNQYLKSCAYNYENLNNFVFKRYKTKKRDLASIKSINQTKIEYEKEEFERGFKILATIASIAPYLGLLGTVIGIMNSFLAIAESGNVSLSYIAPSISESLIVTAVGLFVAIPSNYIFNDLIIRTEKVFSFYYVLNEEYYINESGAKNV